MYIFVWKTVRQTLPQTSRRQTVRQSVQWSVGRIPTARFKPKLLVWSVVSGVIKVICVNYKVMRRISFWNVYDSVIRKAINKSPNIIFSKWQRIAQEKDFKKLWTNFWWNGDDFGRKSCKSRDKISVLFLRMRLGGHCNDSVPCPCL